MCVVIASGGYPGAYEKGKVITGLDRIPEGADQIVFHAGTRRQGDQILTSGGRVLGVTALADTLPAAREKVYALVPQLSFDNMYYRKDIAQKALKRVKT